MIVHRIGPHRVGISSAPELLARHYAYTAPDLSKYTHQGPRLVSKAAEKKLLAPPYSMGSLLDLLDSDEYHSACVDATATAAITQVQCSHPQVTAWLAAAQFPGCEDEASILTELLRFYLACGNGFLLKMRNAQGLWVGLERMLPSEVSIVEKYDAFGFFTPDYIQTKNAQKRDYPYADVIHLKRSTHKSNAWGLACLPVALNIEILAEIKTYDYNNFKNGLMVDYLMIVEGGTLRDGTVTDEQGNEVIADAFTQIQNALADAKGNAYSHSTILIESEAKDVKIRLEPLRQSPPDGGFSSLKKDLREGIFAYHRVPPRVVSQLVSGQLGGDNNSDMALFYHFVVKPLQNRLALTLANEFNVDFPAWKVLPTHFSFGDLTELLRSPDESLFAAARNA